MTLKELKEKLGDARKRKKQAVDERASKLQELEALMTAEGADQKGSEIEALRGEIAALTDKAKAETELIDNYTDQIADQFETDGYKDADFNAVQPGAGAPPVSDKQKEKNLYQLTANIFTTLADKRLSEDRKIDTINDIQKQLYQGGHYDGHKAEVDGFNTLVDSDGGIYLPTTISDRIFEISDEFGAFSRHGLRFPMSIADGSKKVPNLLGDLKFYAVNEGSEAKASSFTFSGIELKVLKWMTYIPWTAEMDELQGRRLVEIILRKLGKAVARLRDNVIVNADGTSDYHNLKGLITRSADASFKEVRESTAASGHDAFGKIDPDDFLISTLDIAKSLRDKMRFALDPDWRVYLKQMKDENGIPYYKNGSSVISIMNGEYFIHDVPVDFTEAIPSTDGAGKVYGVGYVPEYYAFADNGQFVIEQFNTGSIPNEDGKKDAINLLSQDMKAARAKTFFDFELSQVTKDDNGTEKGAFTVLKTASA